MNENKSSQAVIPSILVQQPEPRKKYIPKFTNIFSSKVSPNSLSSQPSQYQDSSERIEDSRSPIERNRQSNVENQNHARPVPPYPAPSGSSKASSLSSRSKISKDKDTQGTNREKLENIYENGEVVNQAKKARNEVLV